MVIRRMVVLVAFAVITTSLFAAGAQEEGSAADELAGMGFQSTGFPIVQEQTELVVMAYRDVFHTKDYEDFELVNEMEEKTNVRIVWEVVPANAWQERVNLTFASGDLPEVFLRYINKNTQLTYGPQGLLLPLQDLLDEYAPNLTALYGKYPSVIPAATAPDGSLYALPGAAAWPFVVNPDVQLVNMEWLERLGLERPKTLAEFEEMLVAFRDQDPNGNGEADEIPWSFRWNTITHGPYSMFGMFGRLEHPNTHVVIEDGEVVFTADKLEHKDALMWFQRLYSEGLIDQEALIQDVKQLTAKGKAQPHLLGTFTDWNGINIVGSDPMYNGVYDTLLPLKGPGGQRVWFENATAMISHGEAAVTSEARYPELAMRWLDAVAEPMVTVQWSQGPFGYVLRQEDGKVYFNDTPSGMGFGEFRHARAPGRPFPTWWTQELVNAVPNENIRQKFDRFEAYRPFFPEESVPDLFFSPEQTEELSTLQTDIDSFVDQKQAEWIMGADIDAEWDSYVNQLNQMGLERYVEIYQDAYDSYLTKMTQ